METVLLNLECFIIISEINFYPQMIDNLLEKSDIELRGIVEICWGARVIANEQLNFGNSETGVSLKLDFRL